MKQFFKYLRLAVFCLVMIAFYSGCKKNDIKLTTTDDVNIVDYMRRYPDQFSEFVKILDRVNVSPFLNAYGAYTVFAPTNDAIKLYLTKIGKNSTDDMDTATLLSIVRLHIIQDTISTQSFTDGKLTSPTMYGQYLITSVNDLGATVVNRQATITQSNILTGNGYIHVIDHVLEPATLTLAKLIEQDPQYSIFTQALKATRYYDTLNTINTTDSTRRWLTVLAEPDAVLKAAYNITDYSGLVKRYNNTGNATRLDDSLNLFVAYHILPGLKYVADLVSIPSHATLVPQTVVNTKIDGQRVLLNELTFNGVFEPGIPVNRPNSDISATNGVLHSLLGDIYLKIRVPVRVDWDLCAQPEVVKLGSVFRKPGKSVIFAYGQLSEVTWQNPNIPSVTQAGYFTYTAEPATTSNFYWFSDGCGTNLRFGNAGANNWIEFITPLLVKGKYKVWIMFRNTGNGLGRYVQASIDGVPAPRLVDFTSNSNYSSVSATDLQLESEGWKFYATNSTTDPAVPANRPTAMGGVNNNNNRSETFGVVDITSTDRHKFRMTAVRDAGSGVANNVTLDFVQFIPYTGNPQDQIGPLYNKQGQVLKYP